MSMSCATRISVLAAAALTGAAFGEGVTQTTAFPGGGSRVQQASAPVGFIRINEIRIDQPSTDNDEYFELEGSPGFDLAQLWYIVIGDGTGGSGVIESVVDLTGQACDATGYFVAAESTFTIGTADLVTSLNFENSDNVTHLLVANFIGANGDDLDLDDDGVLDVTPWSAVIDAVGMIEEPNPPSATEYSYGAALGFVDVGPDGTFVPGHIYRCGEPGGGVLGPWAIGLFDIVGGKDTPNSPNPDCPAPGACCFPDGSCTSVFEAECIDVGGTFAGDGTDCASANCPQPCPADLDGSTEVGFDDLLQLLGAWGPCAGCPADLDGNGEVDFNDLLALLAAWGPCP